MNGFAFIKGGDNYRQYHKDKPTYNLLNTSRIVIDHIKLIFFCTKKHPCDSIPT
jgi:hypothetical protein